MTGSERLPLTVPSLLDLVWALVWRALEWRQAIAAWVRELGDPGGR